MLVQLEEWAQSLNPATTPDETENTPEEDLTDEEIKAAADEQAIADIVALWKVSRYYYLANGLFINTATKFNEYVDIYANREKCVSLQPDLRHCQEMIIRAELGEQLYSYLMDISVNHTPTAEQAETLRQIQFTLALFVESRNKMFKRPEAKDEAYLHLASAKEYILAHAASLNEKAVKASPFYKAPAEAASEAAPSATAEQPRKKRPRRGFMLEMPNVKN